MRAFTIDSGRLALLGAGAVIFFAGCQRESITSYQVPKEDYAIRLSANPQAGATQGESSPHVHWELPKGWQEKTGQQIGVGSFRIESEDGKFAEVRVVPLKFGPDIEPRSIEMWREELGLPESATNSLKKSEVEVAGLKANLYDMTSVEPRFLDKYKARTLAAILSREGMLWFIKMSGEESVVSAQEQSFRGFLKSLSFHEEEHGDTAVAENTAATAGQNWKAPATWKQQPAGQMVLAAYSVTKGSGAADVSVSSFDGDVGGLVANVNRWRGQVKLGPIAASDLQKEVKTLDLTGGAKASVVDITGTNPKTGKPGRLYGLIVPRGGKTWFYKMIGDPEVVGTETANLAEFAANAH
jgi:hypothetical protein